MKLRILFSLLFTALLISCSSEDSDADSGGSGGNNGGGTGGGTTLNSYIGLATGNWWAYDVEQTPNVNRDSLYIDGTTTDNGNTYYTMMARQPAAAFMSQALNGNGVREESETLFLNGTIGFDVPNVGNFQIPVNDAKLYDGLATPGTMLSQQTGSLSQTIQGFDVDLNYIVSSFQEGTATMATIDGVTYNDIITSKVVMNLEIIANITVAGFPVPVTIMQAQDALVVDNTWGGNIGLLKSDATIDYTLEDFSSFGIMLPIPQSATVLTTQTIDTYNIN